MKKTFLLMLLSLNAWSQEYITVKEFYQKLGTAQNYIKMKEIAEKDNELLKQTVKKENFNQQYNLDEDVFFLTDTDSIIESSGKESLIEARKEMFKKFPFSKAEGNFQFPYPVLSHWDILPHPPIQKLAHEKEYYTKRYSKFNEKAAYLMDQNFQKELNDLTESDLSYGNKAIPLQNRDVFVENKKMLYGAKDFILMSNMFATCDESVMPIVDLLESKIKEGIPVHMIVERVFAIKYSGCLKKLKKIGVNLFYNDNMIKLKNRLVYHDKFCVVDNKKALVYGANLFDSEIDSTGFNHMFRDSGIALSGPVVTDLALAWMSLAFQLKDKKAQKDLLEIKSKIDKQFVAETKIGSRGLGQIQKKNDLNGTCRVVIQSPATKLNAMGMLYAKLVDKAQKSVYVSLPRLPYTLENEADPLTGDVLKTLLKKSQENGDFQVDIMTNNKMVSTDVKSKNFKKTGVLTSLYKFFVKMEDTIKVVNSSREYFGGKNKRDNFNVWNYFQFTHGKTLMIDNAVYVVGSYNLNETSNNTSFEMGVMCYDRELVEEAQNSMILDMINSVPILE